jgi:hypothetical protein
MNKKIFLLIGGISFASSIMGMEKETQKQIVQNPNKGSLHFLTKLKDDKYIIKGCFKSNSKIGYYNGASPVSFMGKDILDVVPLIDIDRAKVKMAIESAVINKKRARTSYVLDGLTFDARVKPALSGEDYIRDSKNVYAWIKIKLAREQQKA